VYRIREAEYSDFMTQAVIHFDENIATDVSSILDGLDCDKAGWSAYCLSFATVEATKAVVDSAEWE